MVTFTFGRRRKMQPQGKRHYAIDVDRPCVVEVYGKVGEL
jgi:hypothetical protein